MFVADMDVDCDGLDYKCEVTCITAHINEYFLIHDVGQSGWPGFHKLRSTCSL